MGFFDAFKAKPAGATNDFGRIDPNNPQAFYAATTEFGQSVMGGPAAQQAFFAKYGLRDQAHWTQVQLTLTTKWANQPGGAAALSAAAYANSAAQTAAASQAAMAQYPGVPAEELTPIEGFDLAGYAKLVAAREMGQPQVLAQLGVDEAKFNRIDAAWKQRMAFGDPNRAVIAATLSGQYQMALAQAKMPKY